MICENSFFCVFCALIPLEGGFLVYIPMKKQLYESPEAEVLEIELEYRLLVYQIDNSGQDEYDPNL